jgi:riboflavin biosynthesis pyrimidine reductase
VKQLVPDVVDVGDLAAHEAGLERPAPGDRPWVLCNMIASADGAVAIDGVSGPLGGPADKAMFRSLRAVADVILVGATTARQERYRPPTTSDPAVATRRRRRGQSEAPRLAVVTAGGDLDPTLPFLGDPSHRPFVVVPAALDRDRRRELERRAEVLVSGEDRVDLGGALQHLHAAGARVVLSEGGPSLNGQLVAAGLVDEWRLTLSPMLVAGQAARAAVGGPSHRPHRFTLDRLLLGDDLVFARYLRR